MPHISNGKQRAISVLAGLPLFLRRRLGHGMCCQLAPVACCTWQLAAGVGVFRSGNIMRSNRFADGRCTFRANCSSMSGMRLGHASPHPPLSAHRVQHLPQHCCMHVEATLCGSFYSHCSRNWPCKIANWAHNLNVKAAFLARWSYTRKF